MKGTDRLREYVKDAPASSMGEMARAIVAGITDEIEREVGENERFRREAEPFHNRLREAVDKREDVTLFGVDYTALPLDADGVPIHIGDEMDEGKVAKVVLTDEHWEPSVYVYKLPNVQHEYFCNEVAHHHAPTVEDVLRELLDAWDERGDVGGIDLSKYAAKLTLRGDE